MIPFYRREKAHHGTRVGSKVIEAKQGVGLVVTTSCLDSLYR